MHRHNMVVNKLKISEKDEAILDVAFKLDLFLLSVSSIFSHPVSTIMIHAYTYILEKNKLEKTVFKDFL